MERLLAEKGLLTDRYPARWIALKVLENDSEILRQVERMPDVAAQLRADRETVADHLRDTLQTSPEAIIADYRYGFIRGVLRSGAVRRESAKDRLELSDKLDKVLTNTLFGPLIMLGVLYAMFQLTFVIGAYPQGWVEDGFGWLGETVSALMPDGFLKSLIVSGVIDGLGGVMSFVPLIIIMFTLVAILEDFGYMARMAYMLDRVFRAFGQLAGGPLDLTRVLVHGHDAGGSQRRTCRHAQQQAAACALSVFISHKNFSFRSLHFWPPRVVFPPKEHTIRFFCPAKCGILYHTLIHRV